MLDKDNFVRDTLRLFMAEVQRFEIDNKEEVDDTKAVQIINKMIKQRNDSISQFRSGGRDDLADKEQSEVDVLSKYKPEQLSEEDVAVKVKEAIAEVNASSMADMGKVMGIATKELSGKADGKTISQIVRKNLNN